MQPVFATLVSAALMWAAFPPLDLGFLAFVGPAPFLWALRRARSARESWWLGFVYGFAFFGAMLWWIIIFGPVAWLPLTAALATYAGLYGLVLHLGRTWSSWRWWTLAVGGWALWEFLRARFPLGGFPWGSAGMPIGTIPGARGAAQWIGPTGWSVMVIAVAAGLALLADEERDRRPLEVGVAVVLGLSILGAIFSPSAGGPTVRVAMIQGDSPCPRVHCTDEKQIIYNNHLTLTRTIATGAVDLVVWGEDAFGGQFNPTFNPEVASQMGGEALRIGAYLLAGGTRPAGPGFFDNYNVVFAPDGSIIGEYRKTHPVPFGEFVPMRELLEIVPQLDQVPNDMRRGDGPVVFPIEVRSGRGLLGSVISFEGAFIRTMRGEVGAGADLLVVATNEGSYGRGPASDQLIGMVRMGAASLGMDVVQVAVTGRSTIIRADGSVGKRTALFEPAVVIDRVHLQDSRRTLYAATGDWLQLAFIASAVLVAVSARGRSRGFKIRPGARR